MGKWNREGVFALSIWINIAQMVAEDWFVYGQFEKYSYCSAFKGVKGHIFQNTICSKISNIKAHHHIFNFSHFARRKRVEYGPGQTFWFWKSCCWLWKYFWLEWYIFFAPEGLAGFGNRLLAPCWGAETENIIVGFDVFKIWSLAHARRRVFLKLAIGGYFWANMYTVDGCHCVFDFSHPTRRQQPEYGPGQVDGAKKIYHRWRNSFAAGSEIFQNQKVWPRLDSGCWRRVGWLKLKLEWRLIWVTGQFQKYELWPLLRSKMSDISLAIACSVLVDLFGVNALKIEGGQVDGAKKI